MTRCRGVLLEALRAQNARDRSTHAVHGRHEGWFLREEGPLLPREQWREEQLDTVAWMHLLGLREGLETHPSKVLSTAPVDRRARTGFVRHNAEADRGAMQAGLMRVMGMLYVECAQLFLTHRAFRPPEDTVEAKVEGGETDEEESICLQTSMDRPANRICMEPLAWSQWLRALRSELYTACA